MPIQDFIPILAENANTIRARLEADVNAGLDPADPSFLDTTPGGFWYDLTQPVVLEQERIYDIMGTDLPASMLPMFAWGEQLDEHGLVVNVQRKDAAFAVGVVTFNGTVGTLIATGTLVGVQQSDPNVPPVTYAVTGPGGTMPGGGTIDLPVQAVSAGADGNVAVGQVTVLLSVIAAPDGSPGISSITNAAAMSGGADIENDDKYRTRILIEWQSAHGGGTIGDMESYALAYPGVGFVRVIPTVSGPGTTGVIVTDVDNHPLGAGVVSGLQDELDPPSVTTALNGGVTLPTGTITVDDTTGFDSPDGRVRIAEQVVRYTGVTPTTITGCTGGTGTIADDTPVYQVGRGNGLAPIDMIVLVSTPTAEPVAVHVTPVFDTGYSFDGSSGTIDVSADIIASLGAYLNALGPGDDVIIARVISQVLLIPGVLDVTALTLDAGGGPVSTNIAINDAHIAEAGAVTFS